MLHDVANAGANGTHGKHISCRSFAFRFCFVALERLKSIGSLVELPFWVVGVQAKNGLAFTVELTVASRSRMPAI